MSLLLCELCWRRPKPFVRVKNEMYKTALPRGKSQPYLMLWNIDRNRKYFDTVILVHHNFRRRSSQLIFKFTVIRSEALSFALKSSFRMLIIAQKFWKLALLSLFTFVGVMLTVKWRARGITSNSFPQVFFFMQEWDIYYRGYHKLSYSRTKAAWKIARYRFQSI